MWKKTRRNVVLPAALLKMMASNAKLGYGNSLDPLKTLYKAGLVSKEDFSGALRGFQAAIEATKSPQREEANARFGWLHYNYHITVSPSID